MRCRRGWLCLVAALACSRAWTLDPLTGVAGNPDRGREIFLDRDRGHCLLCHQVAQLDAGFQGNIGPPLSDAGSRLGPARIRARIVDPTLLNPNTVMPAYYRTGGLTQVAEAYRGKPILSAQEIEDVVAFVSSLTGSRDD